MNMAKMNWITEKVMSIANCDQAQAAKIESMVTVLFSGFYWSSATNAEIRFVVSKAMYYVEIGLTV